MESKDTKNERLDGRNDAEQLVQPDLPIAHEETERAPELQSPYPTDRDIQHAEWYDADWIMSNHEIRSSESGWDLFRNGKFTGDDIIAGESMDPSAYFSAVHDAYETGRGVWKSEDESTLYLAIIIRNDTGTYDWHAYSLNRETLAATLHPEREIAEASEAAAEEIISPDIEVVADESPAASEAQPATFTLKDLRAIFESTASESIFHSTGERASDEERATGREESFELFNSAIFIENPSVETSDVAISVDNALIGNDDRITTVDPIPESLLQETSSEVIAVEIQPAPSPVSFTDHTTRPQEHEVPIASTKPEEKTDASILLTHRDKKSSIQIEKTDSEAPEQKNEALISPITLAKEAARTFVPEKITVISESAADIQAHTQPETRQNAQHEELVETIPAQLIEQSEQEILREEISSVSETVSKSVESKHIRAVETIESFDEPLMVTAFEASKASPEVSRSSVTHESAGTESTVESDISRRVETTATPETIAAPPIIPQNPDGESRANLERFAGIHLVEKTDRTRIAQEPPVFFEVASPEKTQGVLPLHLEIAKVAQETGISMIQIIPAAGTGNGRERLSPGTHIGTKPMAQALQPTDDAGPAIVTEQVSPITIAA